MRSRLHVLYCTVGMDLQWLKLTNDLCRPALSLSLALFDVDPSIHYCSMHDYQFDVQLHKSFCL